MPNWCKNNLKLSGNNGKLLDVVLMLKDDDGQMTFNKVVPMPKELEDTTSPVKNTVPQEERDRLKEKYGADNWYDWRLNNWGCKWNASESEFIKDGDSWFITFQTPWSPPIEFLKEFSKKFKDVNIELQYADESQGGQPLGGAKFFEGIVVYNVPEDTDEAISFGEKVWDEEWVESQ